jgi:hypothetical protein
MIKLSSKDDFYFSPSAHPSLSLLIPISRLIKTRKRIKQFGAHRLLTWKSQNNVSVLAGNENTLKKDDRKI